jgi:hypothetical protein
MKKTNRVSEETLRRLEEYCEEMNVSQTACVEEALKDWLMCVAATRLETKRRRKSSKPTPAESNILLVPESETRPFLIAV